MVAFFEAIHWGAFFQIILIDILLGGDNAVVIALACRKLHHSQRTKGIVLGTLGAVIVRVILIVFAMTLLGIPLLKVVGGLLLLWIGVKLLLPEEEHENVKAGTSVWDAVKTIIIADMVMSIDNVIAIAGAAQNTRAEHQTLYVIFGLLVSIPIIVWGSTLVLKLLDKFPIVVWFGAGLLGWIAGGMLISDTFLVNHLLNGQAASKSIILTTEIVGAIVVIVVGWLLARRKTAKKLAASPVEKDPS